MSWRLAKALEALRDEVQERWPDTTVWTVGDADHRSRPSDHNPDDHDDDASTPGVVSAIDIVDDGRGQAAAVFDHLQETQDDRVEYDIFDGEWSGEDHGWQVKPYGGSNKHRNHVHVSVGRGSDSNLTQPDLFDDPSPWGIADIDEPQVDPPDPDDTAPAPEPDTWMETIVSNLPTLKRAADLSRGFQSVQKLQGLLVAHEVLTVSENVSGDRFDGKFGPSTERAVRQFQSKAGLRVDGIVGPNTWSALLTR